MKKKFSDTYVYKIFDLDRVVNTISMKINPHLEDYSLTEEHLQSILNDFKYKVNVFSKDVIIDDILNGKIQFVEATGVMLPAWCIPDPKSPTGLKAIANVFGKVKIKDKTFIQYQPREVFSLAVIAYILRTFYENEKKISYNSQLSSLAGIIYTRMIMRILDVLYAVNSIPIQSAAISFLIAKFFSRYVMEREASIDLEDNYAFAVAKKDGSVTLKAIQEITNTFDETNFDSLEAFIKGLAANFTVVKDLDINTLLRRMITMYGEKSLLMVENYHYFLAYVISTTYSGGLIKDYIFEGIAGKDGTKLTAQYFAVVK